MTIRGLALGVVICAACATTACADDLTQLVVVVHTDLTAGVDVDTVAVEIDATSAGSGVRRFEESLVGSGALRLPATLSVTSRGGDGRVRVRAVASRAGTVVLERSAVVRFVRGESRMVRLDLLSCCLGVSCDDAQSCGEQGCTPDDRDGVELPRWTGTVPQRASCGAGMDAGVEMGVPDAAIDLGADAGGDAGSSPTCDPLHVPPRPALADDGTGGVRWYAFRSFDFGRGGRFGEIGWDHDDLCTDLDSTTLSCEPAPGFSPPTDGPRGVDNAFAQSLVPLFDLFVSTFFDDVNVDIDRGRIGFLVRVSGWNGLPDDPLVDVSLVDAVEGLRTGETLTDGGVVAQDARVPLPDGGSVTRSLAWDGTDQWYANEAGFLGGDTAQALTRDRSAYVSGGLLVATTDRPTEFTLTAVFVSLPLRLSAGTLISARIRDDGGRLESGLVAGRWSVDDILGGVVTGFGFCLGTPAYDRTVSTLERVADLPTSEAGLGRRCDAVSVGIGFDAVAIELAGLVPTVRRIADCVPRDGGVPDATIDGDVEGGIDDGGGVSSDGGLDAASD